MITKTRTLALVSSPLIARLLWLYIPSLQPVQAQASCSPNQPVLPSYNAWPNVSVPGGSGTLQIAVNINPNWINSLGSTGQLSAQQLIDIQNGIAMWTGTNNVSFVFSWNTTPISGPYTLQVDVAPVPGNPAALGGEIGIAANSDNASLSSARIYVAYNQMALSNDSVLQSVLAHETGHSFGLGDWANCSANSVMVPEGCGSVQPGPTDCDKTTASSVATSYTNAPTTGGGGGGDNGGGGDGGGGGGGGWIFYCPPSCQWDDDTNTLTCNDC